jgi:hypothetical protein
MQEGFEPWRPGISADDPEGIVAEALESEARRARPKLRLIQSKVSARESLRPRVIRLDVERALRQRARGGLIGVAVACAIGVVSGFFWCAGLALLAWKSRPALGDAGAFALAAAIQLLAIALLVSWARSRALARSLGVREGTHR